MRLCILVIGIAMYGVGASTAEAQVKQIRSDVMCSHCSIIMENVATLEGAYFDGPATLIARDKAGRFHLRDQADGTLKVYGQDGRFIRQVGRRGAGPGEYEVIRNILPASDGSIHILDAMLARHSVFSADGRLVLSNSVRIQAGLGLAAVVRPDGNLVVNAALRSADEAGYMIHQIDQNGRIALSFDEVAYDSRKKWLHLRLLWQSSDGELLVAKPYAFTIDVYGANMARKETIGRRAEWVPANEPQERPSDGVFDVPFSPRISGMWLDESGLLWLYMLVPSPSWKKGPQMVPGMALPHQVAERLANRARLQSIIEVVDLEKYQVLARLRAEGPLGLAFGGGLLVRSIENSVGEPSVQISRVQLKR